MGNVITICDKESEFVEKLAEYLNEKYRSKVEVMAFDDANRLLHFEKKNKSVISLVGEGLLDAYQTQELIKMTGQLMYLTKKRSEHGIFKYQSVEGITKELMNYCLEHNLEEITGGCFCKQNRKAKLIGFYSPVHHILQSSLALTMGQILSKNKKVLYLNFEPYSGFEFIMQKKFEHDLMDVMFFLKEEDTKFRYRLESMTETVGQLDYIPPVFSFPDMEEIDPRLWKSLITRIIQETEYEIVLLDLTEQVHGLFSILEMCENIFCCHGNDGLALAKIQQYENLLGYIKKNTILEHTKKCNLPVFREVPYQAALFTHSQLADYVKKIMKETEMDFDGKL